MKFVGSASILQKAGGASKTKSANAMTGRDLMGMISSGIFLGGVFIAVIAMPPVDDAADKLAQAKAEAEAKMKARLFTKYPDRLLAESEYMTFPVAAYPATENGKYVDPKRTK